MSNDVEQDQCKQHSFLFTRGGGSAVLAYLRNIPVQVLIGTVAILAVFRAHEYDFSWTAVFFWLFALSMMFVFIYTVLVNTINFLKKITDYMDDQVRAIRGFKASERSHSIWRSTAESFQVLGLVFRRKKLLFLEFILILIFVLVPTSIIVIMASFSSFDLYSKIFINH